MQKIYTILHETNCTHVDLDRSKLFYTLFDFFLNTLTDNSHNYTTQARIDIAAKSKTRRLARRHWSLRNFNKRLIFTQTALQKVCATYSLNQLFYRPESYRGCYSKVYWSRPRCDDPTTKVRCPTDWFYAYFSNLTTGGVTIVCVFQNTKVFIIFYGNSVTLCILKIYAWMCIKSLCVQIKS